MPSSSLVTGIIANIKNVLGVSAGPESEPAQSQPQSLPPESPSQSNHNTTTHVVSSVPASMNNTTNSAEIKQRIYSRFEGVSGFEIEISDDEGDNDVQVVSPSEAKKGRISTRRTLNPPVAVTRIRREPETAPLKEQQETEEHLSKFFQDRNKVELRARRTNREMPFGKSNSSFVSGGLRPVNTITSTKNAYYQASVHRDRSALVLKKDSPVQKHQITQKEPHPPKRRRTRSPERSIESFAGPVSRSYDDNTRSANPAVTRARKTLGDEAEHLNVNPPRTTSPRSTALRYLNSSQPNKPNEGRRVVRQNSPDDLFDGNVARQDESDFTRAACKERKSRLSDTDEEKGGRRGFKSPTTTGNNCAAGDGTETKEAVSHRHRAKHNLTPHVPKMTSRLDESPDVLQIAATTSARSKRLFAGPSKSPPLDAPPGRQFRLQRFIIPRFLSPKDCQAEVEATAKTLCILYKDPLLSRDAVMKISIHKIIRIDFPSDNGSANLVRLSLSTGVVLGNQCFLDFGASEKACSDCVSLILEHSAGIKVRPQKSSWIVDALHKTFADLGIDLHQQAEVQMAPSLGDMSDMSDVPDRSMQSRPTKHTRKVDQLDANPVQNSPGQNSETMQNEIPSGKHRSMPRTVRTERPQLTTRIREPRTRVVKQTQENAEPASAPAPVKPRREGPEWEKPLIYPKTGKARATVTWEDLERLNDEEFLNDNLIGMFMRYLQEHMDPELAKKTHFFSSFFYNSLMRPIEKNKLRQINYGAVANWTKAVNLFSRDYVIVPVNESAHWYVMIICNLRSLKERYDQNGDEDVVEIDNPAANDGEVASDTSKTILESDIVAKVDIPNDSDHDEGPKTTEQTSAKKRAGRRKSHQFRQRKYSVNQPVIITLDSLGLSRSNTAAALKDYIAAEAEDKYELEVSRKDIEGMTAKSIPLQGNFSDCGLYLCMYLEQFVRDPRSFVRSILQREVESFPWPKKLETHALRQRLYDMLQDLYRIQNKETRNIPDIGRILIKDEDYNTKKILPKDIYEPEHVIAGVEYYEQQNKTRKNENLPKDRMLLDDEGLLHSGVQHEAARTNGISRDTDEPIVVEDSQEKIQKHDGTSSRYFPKKSDAKHHNVPDQYADDPSSLAAKMRRLRSPSREAARSHVGANSVIDVTTPVSRISPAKPPATSHTNGRQERQGSVDTDYLTGDQIYEDTDDTKQHLSAQNEKHIDDHDDKMQGVEDEEFNGFDDNDDGGIISREASVIPESVQDEDEDMLLT